MIPINQDALSLSRCNAPRRLPHPEAARTAIFAALNGLVEAGLATWHEQATSIELHGIGGEIWSLDDMGVTRVR